MITFFDLVQKDDFRDFVSKRIASACAEPYEFPKAFPKLYKYRSLSSYSMDDIITGKIALSAIGEFNDVFDGAMHQYGSKKEREEAAEAKWAELETIRIEAQIPDGFYGILKRENIVNPYIDFYKRESRFKFRELDYLATYVCCLSKDDTSPLMWAHYADSNKGICIEYDFNTLPTESLSRKSLFPVAYTANPIGVTDLLTDTDGHVYQYPLDAAVLCAALNKSSIWQYEQEWRLIWVLAPLEIEKRRLTINSPVQPSRICLGYHFLKPFFYYSCKNDDGYDEYKKSRNILRKFMELINFMHNQNIRVAVMNPSVGSYRFAPIEIPIDKFQEFMHSNFHEEQPENMRFYYVVHDRLMDLIEKTQENSHV